MVGIQTLPRHFRCSTFQQPTSKDQDLLYSQRKRSLIEGENDSLARRPPRKNHSIYFILNPVFVEHQYVLGLDLFW